MKLSRKSLALLALLLGSMFLTTGCATPAYSTQERFALIGRNMAFEYATIQDDVDMALLLRPSSRLTMWHIR